MSSSAYAYRGIKKSPPRGNAGSLSPYIQTDDIATNIIFDKYNTYGYVIAKAPTPIMRAFSFKK